MNNVVQSISALRNIAIPQHLIIDAQPNYEQLLAEIGRRAVGHDGVTLFGCAFVQGGRLQFTTAMPMRKMLEISEQDRAKKGANVSEVLEHSNRPREASHEKNIKKYLLDTACRGEKFILPSFTFNFGTKVQDDTPDVTMILLDRGHDGAQTWPAVLLLPANAKLDTTDGAHRRNTINDMAMKLDDVDARNRLLDNAVDVKLVFERSLRDSHQDFADCGKAKPIGKSQIAAYDARESLNHLATLTATSHPFLSEYVDGSANNVNLSAQSHRVWSLSAVRTMIWHIVDNHPNDALTDEQKIADIKPFFDQLVAHLPQLKLLEDTRRMRQQDPQTESVTGKLRERLGGDVALRGIGMVMFARAYLHCMRTGMSARELAEKLATIDWHVLDVERDEITIGENCEDPIEAFHDAIMLHANPIWRPLLVIKPKRYKVSSSSADANACWDRILQQILPPIAQAAE